MSSIYKTAKGSQIDMDRLRLANEKTIAIGNCNVNARGDLLGPGGKIIKTRAQVLAEKNKLVRPGLEADNEFEEFDKKNNQ